MYVVTQNKLNNITMRKMELSKGPWKGFSFKIMALKAAIVVMMKLVEKSDSTKVEGCSRYNKPKDIQNSRYK